MPDKDRQYRIVNTEGNPEILTLADFFGTESEDVRFFESINPPETYGEIIGRFLCVGRSDLKITFVIATHSRTLLGIVNKPLDELT